MNHLINPRICLTACLLLLAVPAFAESCDKGDEEAVAEIRSQRAAFNEAIATGDLATIESVLDEDVVLVTGTQSDRLVGRDQQLAVWREDFESDDRAVYVRTSRCVGISATAPIALENGDWRGTRASDPDAFAAGRYVAKWRLEDGLWRIEGEMFSTEDCGGDFCPEPEDAQ